MPLLFIDEFGNQTQQKEITETDIEAAEDGCLDIFRLNGDRFQMLIHQNEWVDIQDGPAATEPPCPT